MDNNNSIELAQATLSRIVRDTNHLGQIVLTDFRSTSSAEMSSFTAVVISKEGGRYEIKYRKNMGRF